MGVVNVSTVVGYKVTMSVVGYKVTMTVSETRLLRTIRVILRAPVTPLEAQSGELCAIGF